MKINLDDPNLTAYALGELPAKQQRAMEAAVAQSLEAQAFVQETQQLARLLRRDFEAELERANPKPLNIMPLAQPRGFWSDPRWTSIGIAAVLTFGVVITAVLLSEGRSGRSLEGAFAGRGTAADRITEAESYIPAEVTEPTLPGNADSAEPFSQSANFNTAEFDHNGENPFLPAAANPFSTFPLHVDTASYANVQRMIRSGTKPPKDAVQIEEMINSFSYDYPPPQPNEPFSITLDASGCPWAPDHRLVRIGLKARAMAAGGHGASNLVFPLAQDVTVQVEFNPAQVASYRLLGYEKRTARKENFNNDKGDAEEIGPGHTVTALYEIVPAQSASDPAMAEPMLDALKFQSPAENSTARAKGQSSPEFLTAKLRYKLPASDKSEVIEHSLGKSAVDFDKAPTDFRFAAAVAEFGMILRASPHKGNGTLGAVAQWAEAAKGRDDSGYRAGFIELVRKAEALPF